MIVKPVSERLGERVHERFFMGEDTDHLANVGELHFYVGEWQAFGAALLLGASQMHGNLEVKLTGWTPADDDKEVGPKVSRLSAHNIGT